jgi:hypothetical protein
VSKWIASSVCRGLASSEAELVRSPEGKSATLERGGDAVRCRGSRRGGLERSGDHSTGLRGPRMGRTVELGRRLSEDWASLGSVEDLGVVGPIA